MYYYAQNVGGDETWQPVPDTRIAEYVASNNPMFTTVLAVSALTDKSTPKEDINKLAFHGPMYFDWDGADIDEVLSQVRKFIVKLTELGVDPETLSLYATGGKGFHCEIPMETFVDKVVKTGVPFLPIIYKEVALDLAVDTLDLRVYSARRGRMWRRPNVLRPNGKYKVAITYAELLELTAESYVTITSAPRALVVAKPPAYALNLAVLYDKMKAKVGGMVAKRKKAKVANTILRADMPSLQALCEGRGLKPGMGFNQIATQLAIMAQHLNWTEEQLVERCAGLISLHQSDSDRYSSESKRRNDLVRMHRYMDENPCYEVSIGGIKSLLSHAAPDLDGIPVSKDDIEAAIVEAVENPETSEDGDPDEYGDLAGVTLNRFGVYANTENGSRRVCALSFTNVEMLKSMETGTIAAIEADIMVNGQRKLRQGMELESFASVQSFNKLCARFGHAFQGTDSNIKGLYMRVVESAKKSGKEFYVTAREGLDIVSIPNHENPEFRTPFMIWADGKGVVLEPRVENLGLNIRFQGYPDTRGQFKVDLGDAPQLIEWLKTPENKDQMREVLAAMFSCQRPGVISKMIGWSVACFYRSLFHKAYGKFPLLHVNAPAGTGKSDMSKTCLGFFYYNQEPRMLSPSSTMFALSYGASGSVTPPLMIDEYKPHTMPDGTRERLKLMFRDAYNCREQQRGGGTRDSDDYRSIHTTTLSAPIWFIAEAVEEEPAVMERVVLVTITKPHPAQASKDFANFLKWQRNSNLLAILGQYIASQTVKRYSIETLKTEFEKLYDAARAKLMLGVDEEADAKLDLDERMAKQGTKERTVYNYSVAAFGLQKFAKLVEGAFPGEFTETLTTLTDGIFHRVDDLAATTQAEWVRVFNSFADMSYIEDGTSTTALVPGKDYKIVQHGGRECLELYIRMAYSKYRSYCRATQVKPLYSGETSFIHGLRDCQARVPGAANLALNVPGGSHVFDMQILSSLGFRGMRGGTK